MHYPKKLMTIQELVAMGYSEYTLRDLVHRKGFPSRQFYKRGPWLIDTEEMEKYFDKHKMKNDRPENTTAKTLSKNRRDPSRPFG